MDESKIRLLAVSYDGDIHADLVNLRRLDGSIPVHEKYGPPQAANFSSRREPGSTAQRRKLHNWGFIQVFDFFHFFHYFD
jgi:hypothetical protein